jgi:60 kDa SS-A/Ro ribonucleoprotein
MPKLAMHAWKYKQRDGWSHRDALRLAHAKTDDAARNAVLTYMTKGTIPANTEDHALAQIVAAEELLHTTDVKKAVRLIQDHRLTREAVPTGLLNEKAIWEALLVDMPVNALVRNLGKMSSIGMVGRMSAVERKIVEVLGNQEQITNSHIHPMAVYIALKTYERGQGFKGSLTWDVNRSVADALDSAFYLSFGNVEKTGKRILLAIDDSGSMRGGWSGGGGGGSLMEGLMSPNEAASAMALVTYMVEPNSVLIGYSDRYREIDLSRKATIKQLVGKIASVGAGTDTSLPVRFAAEKKMDFDAIVSWTDNNTWSGYGHVAEHLRNYQNKVGHPVRFLNAAMESNSSTDVDPTNPNMLELTGMDANTPKIISEFVAGRI